MGGNPADARGLDISPATALNTLFKSIPDGKYLHKKGDSIKHVLMCENPPGLTSSGRTSEEWTFLRTHTHTHQMCYAYTVLLYHLFITKHSSGVITLSERLSKGWSLKIPHTPTHIYATCALCCINTNNILICHIIYRYVPFV